ncbi:ATP-binding protein [Neofamilia massiliensis]
MLFNLLSSRNGKVSIIVTMSLDFNKLEKLFKDSILTKAIINILALLP